MTPQQQLHHILREAYDIAGATHQLDAFAVLHLLLGNEQAGTLGDFARWACEFRPGVVAASRVVVGEAKPKEQGQ